MASISSVSVQPTAAPPPPATAADAGATIVARNTDRLGRVNVQAMVQDIKRLTPDAQGQRDIAAAAAKSIGERSVRSQFVDALKDAGVARKPGWLEQQWQGAKGLVTGVYEGGASLVGGVYELGKLGVQGTVATAKFGYNYATDGTYRAQTNQAVTTAATATVDAAGKGLGAARDYAADRIAHPEKLQRDSQAVQRAVETGYEAAKTKVDQVYDGFDKVRQEAVIQGTTDELAGKIVGRVGFEVAALVVPAGLVAKGAKGAELAANAGRAVEGATIVTDAARAARTTSTVAETVAVATRTATAAQTAATTGRAVEGATVVADTARAARTTGTVTEAVAVATPARTAATTAKAAEITDAARAPSALYRGADRALAQTGDDAGRVARVQAEASAITMNSSDSMAGVERASAELLERVAAKRTVVYAAEGSDEMRYLKSIGAEANVGGENLTHILLKENPSKVAVLEEFLHGTQQRLGLVERLGHFGFGSAETHVKDFMIRHQQLLGISDQDVTILRLLRDKGL